jgi:hypothetical protein
VNSTAGLATQPLLCTLLMQEDLEQKDSQLSQALADVHSAEAARAGAADQCIAACRRVSGIASRV